MKKVLIFCVFIVLVIMLIHPQSNKELNFQLFEAVKSGNLEQVKPLVEKGADINARDVNGISILMYAANNGKIDIIKYFISKGVYLNLRDREGRTALYYAAIEGQIETLKFLIKEGAVISTDSKEEQQYVFSSLLIGKGKKDLNSQLFNAIEAGDLHLVKTLVKKGADVNARDVNGVTVLMWASYNGKIDIVKFLLSTGASLDLIDKEGRTALYYGALTYQVEILKFLTKKGRVPTKEENSFVLGLLYSYEGKNFYNEKNYGKAVEFFMKALRLSSKDFECFYCLLEALAKLEAYEESEKLLMEALNLLKKKKEEDHKKFMIDFYALQAENFSKKYRYEEEIKAYQKAYEISKGFSKKDEAFALTNLGRIYEILNQYKNAIRSYEDALLILHKIGIQKEEAMIYNELGNIYKNISQYTDARKCYERALILFQKNKIQLREAGVLHNMGLLYAKFREYEQAIEYFERAININHNIKDWSGEANALIEIGSIWEELRNHDKVMEFCEKAIEICENISDLKIKAETLRKIGTLSRSPSIYQKSVEVYEKFLDLCVESRDKDEEALTLNELGKIYLLLYKFENAINYFEHALKISRQTGNWRVEIVALQRLGMAYIDYCEYENAIEKILKAFDIARNMKDTSEEITALNNLGFVYDSMGLYKKAIKYYEQAMEKTRKKGEYRREITFLNNLGMAYYNLGDFSKALEYHNEALLICQENNDREGEGLSLNNLALNYSSLNAVEEALKYYNESLNITRESKNLKNEGTILCNIGAIYADKKQHSMALDFYNKSLIICRDIPDHLVEGHVLNNMANSYRSLGDIQKTIDCYEQALNIYRKYGFQSGEACALNNIGSWYKDIGEYNKALSYLTKASLIYNKIGEKDGIASNQVNHAFLYSKLNQNEKAVEELEKATDILESIRYEVKQEEFKISFFSGDLYIYNFLFDLYEELGQYQKAFETAEKSKSVVFAEIMAKRGARQMVAAENPGFQKIMVKETKLLQQINIAKTKMRGASGGFQQKLSQRLFNLDRELSIIQAEMKQKFPHYAEFLYPEAMELKKLHRLLKEDETYVSFYLLKDCSVAFVVSQDSLQTVRLEVKKEWVEEKVICMINQVKESHEALKRISDKDMRRFPQGDFQQYSKFSNEFYQKIFKPLELYITTKKVLISADGFLYGFPLEALITKLPEKFEYNGKIYLLNDMILSKQFFEKIPLFCEFSQMQYLGEKYSISYIPTASTLDVLRGELVRKKEVGEGVIAFADPIFAENQVKDGDKTRKAEDISGLLEGKMYVKSGAIEDWPPPRIPETAEEAEIFVSQIGKGTIYKGLDATEENVWKAGLEKVKYILFSTHGILGKEADSKYITEPALVLTLVNNPEGYDGLLGMTEAAGLRLNSDVVILSACNSAGDSGKGGEGFAGMARSFLFAGSQAVVASHWPVDSKATKMLIENYGKFLKTKGRLEALEEARNVVKNAVVEYGQGKRKIQVSYAHPYFWASFVLLGER